MMAENIRQRDALKLRFPVRFKTLFMYFLGEEGEAGEEVDKERPVGGFDDSGVTVIKRSSA